MGQTNLPEAPVRRWITALAAIGLFAGCHSSTKTTHSLSPASMSPATQPLATPATTPVATTQSPYDKWEREIQAYEAADRAKLPEPGGIVFVGSSTIRMWSDLAEDFPAYNVLNRGFGGSQVDDSVHFLDRIVVPYAPRMIVLNAGTNDIASGKSAQTVFDDFKRFAAKARASLPNTRIAFLAIQPAPSRIEQMSAQAEANRLISDWIYEQNRAGGNFDYIEVVDQYLDATGKPDPKYYLPDRLHGNDAGYKIRADVVRPHLDPNYALPTTRPAKQPAARTNDRPNIIVILCDDMGYSDLGCYGSEIQTPNLDKLASEGLRYTQFYNTARCCPTRASLLTGLYQHQAGVGEMIAPTRDLPGYEGNLSNRAATIAQVLGPAGYRCYMTGKWHVTSNQFGKTDDKSNWPTQRGFEKYYGIISGASDFYDPGTLCRQNDLITVVTDPVYQPKDYYFTDAISDNTTMMIRDHAKESPDKPFFFYVAYTAAHWPLHAKPADIAKYDHVYDAGYEPIRRARFEKQKQLGVITQDTQLSPQDFKWPDDAKRQQWNADCMEVYAAQVDCMDQGVGRIVQTLRETNQLDNTLILFLQDNGGCAENIGRDDKGFPNAPVPPADPKVPSLAILTKTLRDGRPVRTGPDTTPGPQDTYISYGQGWANVSNTPFREYKHYIEEGGISTPLIAHWPRGIAAHNELRTEPGHLVDVMATCVDVAQARYPTTLNGHAILPMEGLSLRPTFTNQSLNRTSLFWEHEGNRALRMGDYKIVAKGAKDPWRLYNIAHDRAELNDLSAKQPERRRTMIERWNAEAKRVMAYPWPWDPINND